MRLRSGGEISNQAMIESLLQQLDQYAQFLEIRPSSLVNGGDGLYTTVSLPAHKPIVLYYGVLKPRQIGRYVIKISSSHSLDAEPCESFNYHGKMMLNLGRYVNDAYKSKWDNNMRYGVLLREGELRGRPAAVVMSSKRRIQPGEELLASYGKKYWSIYDHLAVHLGTGSEDDMKAVGQRRRVDERIESEDGMEAQSAISSGQILESADVKR